MSACPVCEREMRPSGLPMHIRTQHPEYLPTDEEPPPVDAPQLFETEQAPPVRPKRKLTDRLWGGGEPKETAPVEPGRPRETKPSRPARRVDASDFFERVWAAAGRRIERNLGDVPVGRCLQLTSGATGIVLDDAVKGTAADKPVQWLVRTEEKVSKVGAVLAAPMLVAMIERNPAAADALAPFLVDALMSLGPSMIKALKKAEKRRAEFAEAMAGIGPALGLGPDEPVTPELLLQWLFPPVTQPEPQPRQEAA